jgi:hypothetical protein
VPAKKININHKNIGNLSGSIDKKKQWIKQACQYFHPI